ncbi:MAG TPA: peptidyl-prolyl cis-trans isomerase [Anaeromyxobacter sp.]|nr:peptidyl-prolyl cis-trans isomerase [Anaeromyxobacter sp.]
MLRRTAALGLGLAFALAGCKGKGSGPVLAKGEGFEITADEVRTLVESQMPFQRKQLEQPGRKTALVQQLVKDEVLFARAKEEGLLEDPQVKRVLRTVMVQRLKAKHQPAPTDPTTISAEEVAKYYAEHPADFEKRVGATVIAFFAAPDSPQRAEKRAAAERALAQLRDAERKAATAADPQPASTRAARPGTAPASPPAPPSHTVATAFTKLVAEVSEDDATKRFGGSLGFKTRKELEQSHSPEVAAAVFSLAQGGISDVVETPRGFFIVRANAVREQTSLDQARPHIQVRIARTRDEQVWTDYVKKVQDEADVKLDEAAIEALTFAPAQPAMAGPGAGADRLPAEAPPAGNK